MKEIISKRKAREKHFLKPDGTIEAHIYDYDVHYKKGNYYEEIDNTLIEEGGKVFNKSNAFKSIFSNNELLKVEKDNNYLKINLNNHKNYKFHKRIRDVYFNDVLNDIDIDYKVIDNKIKESIILKSKPKNNKITFSVDTNMILKQVENKIEVFNEEQLIFVIETPFMMDTNKKYNYNVKYVLKDNNTLELLLDMEWLNSSERAYPVIIDPTITDISNDNNVYDTYIYEGDTNVDRNNQDVLKAGIDSSGKIYRTLLKFNLPEIGTGSQIINAMVKLIGYPREYNTEWDYLNNNYSYFDIHAMTVDWDESTANWNNLHDKYQKRIETYNTYCPSIKVKIKEEIEAVVNEADITNLVKKWYSGTPNYGFMLKAHLETKEANDDALKFFSKNNEVSNIDPKPVLVITYRNQNGLEDYMVYKEQAFNEGTTYINNYNGNMVASFNLISTIGGKMPANVVLYYNTNDVILNNNYGYGLGYKLNYHQTLKEVTIDTKNYLEYLDEDGTNHYFTYDEENDIYQDEDNLQLKIKLENNKYIMTDNVGNKSEFIKNNLMWYLTKIIDSEGNCNIITYDNSNKIIKITDANNSDINITYNDNNITFSNGIKTTMLVCNLNMQVMSLLKNGKTTEFSYNNKNIIDKITDTTGLSIGYEYYDMIPYRVKKITEYSLNNTIGRSLDITYGFNLTTFTDNLGHKNTYVFNDLGNPISITNLDINETLKDAMGKSSNYITLTHKENQLLGTELLQKNVKNYVTNSSFETNESIISYGIDAAYITDETARTGIKSLKILGTTSVEKYIIVDKDGCYYTLSAYFKGNGQARFYVEIDDENTATDFWEGETFDLTDSFERHDYTIYIPKKYFKHMRLYIQFEGEVCFVDDLQVEEGEVANLYNMFDNSDFLYDLDGWLINDELNYSGDSAEIVTLETGLKALKFNHDPYDTNILDKTLNISGKAGDVYFVSFWYKNEGLPTGIASEFPANCLIDFNYTNMPEGEGVGIEPYGDYLRFNETEWQYFSTVFGAYYDYDQITFRLIMENNINSTYITNLSLHKGVTNTVNYDYDENGNIIEITDLDTQTTSFQYDKNNQLISMTSPMGYSLAYEYDNEISSRLLSGISETGISNEIKYDFFGNPIVTRIKATGKKTTDLNGKYYIRLKGTEKYLNSNYLDMSLIMKEDKCSNEPFNVIKENNKYYIQSTYNPKYYIGYENNILKLVKEKVLFEFSKNSNDSYYLSIPNENKYLKSDMTFTNIDETSPEFEFYFHSAENELFIENKAEYTADGKFIKSVTDTLDNTTKYSINSSTGLVDEMIDSVGNKTTYTYDDEDKITSISKGNKTVEYDYNGQSKLSKIKSGNKEYNFEYDEFLKPKSVNINNQINLIDNEYEEHNGNLVKSTYGNNQVTTYTYDEFNRIKTLKKNDGNIYKYKYDKYNRLARIDDKNLFGDLNHKYVYDYDRKERLVGYTFDNLNLKYQYDNEDNVVNKNYKLDNLIKTKSFTYNKENSLVKSVIDDTTIDYNYDALGRLDSKMINDSYLTKYEYVNNGKKTSLIPKSIQNGNSKYSYKYDKLNNITDIYYNSELINKYYYNEFSELIKEYDYQEKKMVTYKYDLEGNILAKKIFDLDNNLIDTINYKYDNPNWEDQLTNFNGTSITYDEIGNPITIGDTNLTWNNGRELKEITNGTNSYSYTYNKDGIRTSKTINGKTTKYFTENSNIIFEQTDNNVIYYLRDSNSKLIGLIYNGDTYYYEKNIQEDIVGILDSNFNLVAKYKYDSWGNIVSITDGNGNVITNPNNIALINPYRYRSYYYDSETKLYYLNSRYYNSKWGRFLNVDGIINGDKNILGYNLFRYAGNNPVVFSDAAGAFWKEIGNFVKKVIKGTAKAIYTVTTYVTQPVFPTASEAMRESVIGDGNLNTSTKNKITKKIKKSDVFKNIVENAISKTIGDKFVKSGSSSYGGLTDMHLSIGKFDYVLEGKKSKIVDPLGGTAWEINVTISDDYDFHRTKEGLATDVLNYFGYVSTKAGIISSYHWDLNFTYIYIEDGSD